MFCSVSMCSVFTIAKGKIRISNVSLLFVLDILDCPLKEVFLWRNLQLGPRKVSVVRRCPLRAVRYIEVSF